MANLKATVETEIERLDKWRRETQERREHEVRRSVENLAEKAGELPKIPGHATDLMLKAVVAQSKEIEFDYDRNEVRGVVSTNGATYELVSYEATTRVPKGKYRALFFLIPVPAEDKTP